jgi:hypothetical protein
MLDLLLIFTIPLFYSERTLRGRRSCCGSSRLISSRWPHCHRRCGKILLLHERRCIAYRGTDGPLPVRPVDRCCLPKGPVPRLARL